MIVPTRYTEIPDWFAQEDLGYGISRIYEPYYREDYRCNIYLVKGKFFDIVIDTGLGLGSLKNFLRYTSRDPVLIMSHAHYDHIGSAHEFERRMIHPAEADLIASPTRENTYADLLLATEDFVQLPWDGYDAAQWLPTSAPCDLLMGSDILDIGGRRFEVMHTPGHSAGSICLWEQKTGILICADTVYEGEIFDHLPCSHIPTYVQTMKRLRKLPVKLALPGHGPLLDNVQFETVIDGYLALKGEPVPGDTGRLGELPASTDHS